MFAMPPSLPPVAPAEQRLVRGELAELPPFSDDVWTGRYVPRGVLVPFRGQTGTPAPYALDVSSLIVRRDGVVLTNGVDYVVDAVYGTICLPEGDVEPASVSLDYGYALLRIDSVVTDGVTGEQRIRRGVSHLTNPHPPRPERNEIVDANLLIDASAEGPQIFAPRLAQSTAPAVSSRGALPRAAETLERGESVRLLFLGDSITEGGDASTDEDTFRAVARRLLCERYPDVEVHTAATGGSRSTHWLDPADLTCEWERVVAAAPQVTVIEFLNDAYLDALAWTPSYDELIARLTALGSEVVLMTPTFAMRAAMNGSEDREDGRPYVRFLREYAQRTGTPLIDVSSRWECLRDEGLPYWTLLANGINHPDDRGHRFTGEFVGEALVRMLDTAEPS